MRENIRKIARLLREAAKELEGMEKLSQERERLEESKYAAIFFSFEGDFEIETRFGGETVEEVLRNIGEKRGIWGHPFTGVVELDPEKYEDELFVVYFDLEPTDDRDYNLMVERLSKRLHLPMTVSDVCDEMEKIYEKIQQKYVAVFFAFDGDVAVEDYFSGNTIEEVLEAALDKGSLWYFYPFVGVAELEEPGETTVISLRETNVVYFDLEPIGEEDYDIMVGELSEVLDLPMPISEVSKEMEKIYNRIWGEEEEFEKSSSRRKYQYHKKFPRRFRK